MILDFTAKLILTCAKTLLKLKIPRKICKFATDMKKKRTNPYKEANEAFLAEKAKEEGIVVLDNGVMYRVLEEGHGTKKPTPRSIVYVHYTGKLIDGTVIKILDEENAPVGMDENSTVGEALFNRKSTDVMTYCPFNSLLKMLSR